MVADPQTIPDQCLTDATTVAILVGMKNAATERGGRSEGELVRELREAEATYRGLLDIIARGGYSEQRMAALANWRHHGETIAKQLGWKFRDGR